MSIKGIFVQVGIVEVAKEVEDPVDLEMLMLLPVPARGEEKRKSMPALDVGARQDEQQQ
jgi:hypothetical protein